MATIDDVAQFLEQFAPASLAEAWDNVGLLVGNRRCAVSRVMTCLTITEASAQEAIRARAELIVAHHPMPFRPFKRLTTDSHEGELLWQLIGAGISIYSPHTAFDSAGAGINARLATLLGLANVQALVPQSDGPGAGRWGAAASRLTLGKLAEQVKSQLNISYVQLVGDAQQSIEQVAIACGSGGDFVSAAAAAGCDVLLTGEARFHTCLEAESLGLALLLAGHYATERFAVEQLAQVLAAQFGDVEVWASHDERDPIALA